jgi:succinate-semialdehyde dehydrogenase/glutarate-semialdehyde dehydrogenase
MAGNTVLLRPSAVVPRTSLLLEQAFRGAGFPRAVFRTILTPHEVVGDIIASPLIKGVAFTGSNEAGADVAAAAGRSAKKCVLELGGSDPFIVLGDADVAAAAKAGAESRLINSGQSCINAKRFIIVDAVYEEFKELFVKEMSSRVVGDPMDPKTDVGPLVRSSQLEEVESQVDDAVRKGAKVLCGGKRIPTRGYYYEPTVLEGCSAEMEVLREEVFGPVAPLINAKDDQEAVALANETKYGLGASIWTRDGSKAMDVGLAIEAGVIFANGAVKSDPRMPFGGVKASGYGREISRQGIREFTNVKGLNLY